MRIAIGVADIKNGKILLVRKKKVWILPGGKPKKEESDTQCLIREITTEELPRTKLSNLKFYKTFKGKSPHRGDIIKVKVYFGHIEGTLDPSWEINNARWIKNPNSYKLSDITQKIIDSLQQDSCFKKEYK